MKHSILAVALVSIVGILTTAERASAYYHPSLGRFTTRDPIAQPRGSRFLPRDAPDGANLYQYVRSNPVRFVDPWGLQATKPGTNPSTTKCACWCTEHPDDCSIKYEWSMTKIGFDSTNGTIDGTTAQGGYKATLVSKGNHELIGCNLHQDITMTTTWHDAKNAVADTPKSFNPPVNRKGFTSTIKDNVVTTHIPNDYEQAGLTISDSPGHSTHNGNLMLGYSFNAKNYVEEAPGVTGTVEFDVKFTKFTDGGDFTYTFKSSDGSINRHLP
jgi:RHS repeat-associated protein